MGNNQDVVNFTKHLSVMVKSGIPIGEAIASLLAQYKRGSFKKALEEILQQVSQGHSFAAALRQHPKFFNDYYISLVEVGEESGNLDNNLDYLAGQLTKDDLTRKKIVSAMLYPGFVIFFAFVIGGGISIFVLPKLVDFFGAFDIPLPLSTRILLSFANLMKNYGILIFAGIFVLFIVLSVIAKIKFVKSIWDRISIRIPFVGNILAIYQITRLCRNLGTLLKSGVPISKALEVCSRSISNGEFADSLLEIRKDIGAGKNLFESMKKYKIYETLLLKMVEVGEKSGKLDESFIYMADYFDGVLDDLTKNLETIIEPALLIVIGIIVGFIAIAIITPIYQLTGSISPTGY